MNPFGRNWRPAPRLVMTLTAFYSFGKAERPCTGALSTTAGVGSLSTRASSRLLPRVPDVSRGCHRLRHTAASAWLAAGVDIATMEEYPGHGDPAFTLRTHTHLMPSATQRARRAMGTFFKVCPGCALIFNLWRITLAGEPSPATG